MDQSTADEYANSWIGAWNSHDIERLGEHYSEDVVFRSPFVKKLTGDGQCTIRGREALKEYLQEGMDAYPHVRFQLHRVGIGIDSLVLNYIGVDGLLANEVHVLDAAGKAVEVRCHYSAAF